MLAVFPSTFYAHFEILEKVDGNCKNREKKTLLNFAKTFL